MVLLESNIQTTYFWDYSIWDAVIQLSIIFVSILISNIIRRKLKFIRNSLIPASVIGGVIIFILKFIPQFQNLINSQFMEAITFHCLGLGFISVALKSGNKNKDKNKAVVIDSSMVVINNYLVQALVGLACTVLIYLFISDRVFYAAGLLLPMGFGQGTGQALNFGNIFEGMGFEGGAAFGLSIAAIGFLVACIVGVIFMNILKKKGKLKLQMQRKEINSSLDTSNIYKEDEAPLNESVDKITIQLAIIFGVYLITFLFIYGCSYLSERYLGNFGVNTLKPLFWGFNFLFGTLFAIITKKIISKTKKAKIMTHSHVNDYFMNRLSGLFFDVMIVSGIAAINWQDLKGLLWPLLLVCALGSVATFFYTLWICKKVYPDYPYEAFFSMFGMLTGTASTGIVLLREIDPNFETPASDNLVLQQVPAIAFGAPVLLSMTFAAQKITNTYIIIGVFSLLFIVYNIILLRRFIFKRKAKVEEPKEVDSASTKQ